jgi:hypothetical protein
MYFCADSEEDLHWLIEELTSRVRAHQRVGRDDDQPPSPVSPSSSSDTSDEEKDKERDRERQESQEEKHSKTLSTLRKLHAALKKK